MTQLRSAYLKFLRTLVLPLFVSDWLNQSNLLFCVLISCTRGPAYNAFRLAFQKSVFYFSRRFAVMVIWRQRGY